MADKKEKKLISDILAGDEKALHRFWQLYVFKLFAFIKRRVENNADAEEILQDALLAFLEALRDFEGQSKLNTFLYGIAKHKIVDYYRKRKVKQVFLSQLPEEVIPLLSAFLKPEEEFDAQEVRKRINEVFLKLTPRYRTILILKYIDSLSVKQIAEVLKVTVKSAESTLFRARMAFVKIYNVS